MRKYLVVIVVLVLGVGTRGEVATRPVSTRAASGPTTREGVLGGKGLVRVGAYYLLEGDVGLPGVLKGVRAAKKKLDDGVAKRTALEGQVRMANDSLGQWYRQMRDVNEEEKKAGRARRNTLAEENNSLIAKIKEGEGLRDRWVKELKGLADTSADYTTAVVRASDAMEGTAKRYEELAADEEVRGAIAGMNGKGKPAVRLGPSVQFQQELKGMRKMREAINTGVVKLEFNGGVPTVMAAINGGDEERMVVDSGAAYVTVTAALAKRLGLTPGKNDPEVELVTASGEKTTAHLVKARSVRVGAFTAEDVQCAVLGKKVKGDSLLGGTFLKNFVYQMDLGAGELHLTQVSGRPAGKEERKVSATMPASRPEYWAAADWGKHIVGDWSSRSGDVVVLKAGDRLSTDRAFAPPVTFKVSARADNASLRLGYACDQMIFNWERNAKEFRIDGGPAGGRHKGGGAGEVPTGQWVEIELTVLPGEMVVSVNGKERYRAGADFSKVDERLSVFTERTGRDAVVMVRSVVVGEGK